MKEGKEKYNFQLNIGFIVFSIIFVYLTITIVVNLMKENNSVCRVEKGQIVNSDSFRGHTSLPAGGGKAEFHGRFAAKKV